MKPTTESVKLAIDTAELDAAIIKQRQLSEAQAAYEAAVNSRSDAQQASGSAVANLLKNAPGGEEAILKEMIRKQFQENKRTSQQNGALDADDAKIVAERDSVAGIAKSSFWQTMGMSDGYADRLKANKEARGNLDIALEKKARDQVSMEVGEAKKGTPGAGDRLSARLGDQPGNPLFNLGDKTPKSLAEQIKENSPEAFTETPDPAGDDQERAEAGKVQRWQAGAPARSGKRKERKDLVRDLVKALQPWFNRVIFKTGDAPSSGEIAAKIKGSGVNPIPDLVDEVSGLLAKGYDEEVRSTQLSKGLATLEAASAHMGDEARRADAQEARADAKEDGRDGAAGAAAENKAQAATDRRLGQVASEHSGAELGIEANIVRAGAERAALDEMDPRVRKAATKDRGRWFGQVAKDLRNRAKNNRRRGPAADAQRQALEDEASIAERRATNPFPTMEQEGSLQADLQAERQDAAGTKDKKGRLLTSDENSKAAQALVAKARQNVDAKAANLMGQGATTTQTLIGLMEQYQGRLTQVEATTQRNAERANGLERRPRQSNMPRGR